MTNPLWPVTIIKLPIAMMNPLNVTSHYYKTAYRHDEPTECDQSLL